MSKPDYDALNNLAKHQCRWPIGDPLQHGFHWCCELRLPDCSYCDTHRVQAYTKTHRNPNYIRIGFNLKIAVSS